MQNSQKRPHSWFYFVYGAKILSTDWLMDSSAVQRDRPPADQHWTREQKKHPNESVIQFEVNSKYIHQLKIEEITGSQQKHTTRNTQVT